MNGKSWHDWYIEERTAGERISDRTAEFVGSWPFIYIHIVWFGFWMMYPVESYPFPHLTTIVSLEALILSVLIMMNQNRQAERDRYRADKDLKTDLEAKKEIDEIQSRLERIEREKIERIIALLESRK